MKTANYIFNCVCGLILACAMLIGATGFAQPVKPVPAAPSKVARLDVVRGTVWVDSGTLTACAIGPEAHATARQGAAVAAVKGSTALAFYPAKVGGAPGTGITVIGKRADGSAVTQSFSVGTTAKAWTWYGLSETGAFRVVGSMTPNEVAAFQAAGKGK